MCFVLVNTLSVDKVRYQQMRPALIIRPATIKDAQAIADIWNAVIRDSAATFTSVEKSAADLKNMLHERGELNHGFYVADLSGTVLGFVTYGPFRNGPGYAHTMEHSVFLAPAAKRKGIGKALMKRLEEHAKDAGLHSLIAGLSAENTKAISFHTAIGYEKVANIKQAGLKFGRWHDLVLMQKLL
jgi:phosphinothricin acetyltransferase